MKISFVVFMICVATSTSFGQITETFDLATYTIPSGWKKTNSTSGVVGYTITDKQKGTYCQAGIYKSMKTMGSALLDFQTDWTDLVAKPYSITTQPDPGAPTTNDGWTALSAEGYFDFNGSKSVAVLLTLSGYGKRLSILFLTNTQDYNPKIDEILGSVVLQIPEENSTVSDQTIQPQNIPAPSGIFSFTSTTFDDGWTSTVQEDWVEVKKGNIKVLLHYPREGTIFPADPEPLTNAAWNILVAPRYKNLKNYKTTYINTYNRPYLGMGYATEIETGKDVFIVFFQQDRIWIEFITPDKNTFIQEFKFDPETIQWDSNSDLMIPLAKMTGHNKFAISASDLKGKWTSDFTGIQQMYNVYTGQYAGMNINQSDEEFIFNEGNNYSWKLLVVNGVVGNVNANEVKSSGTFTVPNDWQVKFSMIENRAKTYHAFWSCIKGARILNLLDADYPGSGIYEKFGLAK